MSRWELTKEVNSKFTPIITEFISKLESEEEPNELLDFSDTELNPYILQKLLEGLGYEQVAFDKNGWQMDFWITMKKKDHTSLCIFGTGITFELKLSTRE